MLRFTVGRRLALVVLATITALGLIVWLVFRSVSADSIDRTVANLEATSASVSQAIRAELDSARTNLEIEAANMETQRPGDVLDRMRARPRNIAVELIDDASQTTQIDVTSNFLRRAASATALGSTVVVDGRVGLIIGTPVPAGDRAGDILVSTYDVSDIMDTVGAARSGASTEALLSVKNRQEEIVIFSPSRHNADAPIGATDAETATHIDEVLVSKEIQRLTDVRLNGRDSVAIIQPIESSPWALIVATDRSDAGAGVMPWWLLPVFVLVGAAALVPIALMRKRLRSVVRGAQQLSRGRLNHELVDVTDDEIGLLARTLQTFDDRLQADTEARGRSAALLQHRASHDPLTGLANRTRLVEELTVALNNRDPLAVVFCDIDDFKGINDSQGHDGGDVVLKFVANQLASVCGPGELIARFGGDEFCVLTRSEPQAARALATRVERALDSSVLVNGRQQAVGGSVGLAVAKVTDTPESVLKSADLAMYREKERRRGLRRQRRLNTDPPLVSPEQIRLAYQPVVDLVEHRIVGIEALARYMHPELGMLDPSSFMPSETERGAFDKFDLEILTKSVEQLEDWLRRGVVDERFTMSLNLSPDSISDTDASRQIFDILQRHRIPASMLQVEVTEQYLHAHEDDLRNALEGLRERGIKVAIDDFGVESSNVDRLMKIPSDVVKIDRSFVSEIDLDERAANRLRAILEIVTTEGRIPIAEGVERQAQATILRSLQVPYAQGYLWHAPISALALTPLLGRASRWSRKKPLPQRD